MFDTFLSAHPLDTICFNGRLFPPVSDRAYWDAHNGAPYIAAAETYLGCPWPMIRATAFMEFSRTGDRKIMENPHFARRKALNTLAVGEIAENHGRFLPDPH